MPTIKTGEWLKATLDTKGMTQKQLANETGLSVPAISKIILGERYGLPKTWEKIMGVLGQESILSVSSTNFINELKKDIELYGSDFAVNAFYTVENGNIVFRDYLLLEDMNENYGNDLKKMNMLQITLKEALELFEAQDKIV